MRFIASNEPKTKFDYSYNIFFSNLLNENETHVEG